MSCLLNVDVRHANLQGVQNELHRKYFFAKFTLKRTIHQQSTWRT